MLLGVEKKDNGSNFTSGDKFVIPVANLSLHSVMMYLNLKLVKEGLLTADEQKSLFEKVNVYPNPLYGYNVCNKLYEQCAG